VTTYYVYSHEPMPRTDLFAARDYNPANDYIGYNSLYIPPITAREWTALPDRMQSLRHQDRSDKQGHKYHVFADEIVKANEERLKPRGVIFLDHEPSANERTVLGAEAEKRNLAFRLACIQDYEMALREAEAQGRTLRPLTYVKECYQVLGMERPGSVEALRAQRQPGEVVADRFTKALEALVEKLVTAKEVAAHAPKTQPAGGPTPTRAT